jgi:hypothetical protein
MKTLSLTLLICATVTAMAFGQDNTQTVKQNINQQYFIGSSLWSLYDKFLPDPAGFYQLNYGYHFTPKDVFIVEAITWEYSEPLGTYENSKEMYPGKVRAFGIGIGYQRFQWKNLYTTIVATPFLQQFYDSDDKKIQKGFQLYFQFILGYRFEFFKKSLFIEPAYAFKYWPVNTNFPKSFADIERGAPNYKFEPSLNFGFRF